MSDYRFQYIHFAKVQQKPKTSVWTCRNNTSGAQLGVVRWHGPWRQYCFFATTPAVYSTGCLRDIQTFLDLAQKGEAA